MTAATTLLPPPFLRLAFRPLQDALLADGPSDVPAHRSSRWRYLAKTLIGAGLCLGVALLIVRVWQGMPAKEPVPLLFIPVIVSTAAVFGRAAGFVSSLGSGLAFSFLLFAPIHRWTIAEMSARNNVVWMLLAGIAISYFMPTVTKSATNRRPWTRH